MISALHFLFDIALIAADSAFELLCIGAWGLMLYVVL